MNAERRQPCAWSDKDRTAPPRGGVVGVFRTGGVDRLEAARQHLARAIPEVGLLVHGTGPLRGVGLHSKGLAPSRALVAGSGETDGNNGFQLLEQSLRAAADRSALCRFCPCASLLESMRSSKTYQRQTPGGTSSTVSATAFGSLTAHLRISLEWNDGLHCSRFLAGKRGSFRRRGGHRGGWGRS